MHQGRPFCIFEVMNEPAAHTFTEIAVAVTAPVLRKIMALPFIQGLADGTLPAGQFIDYIQQDALYLIDYAQALRWLAAQAPDAAIAQVLIGYADGALAVEEALHSQYLSIQKSQMVRQKTSVCAAYTSFLLTSCQENGYAPGLAAILPCFKLYTDVGHAVHAQAAVPGADHPYRAWIDTYASPVFDALTAQACSLADDAYLAANDATRQGMLANYKIAAMHELAFWGDGVSTTGGHG